MTVSNEKFATLRRLHAAEGEQAYHLEVFGNDLAKREGYVGMDGMKAIHYYLILKFHWLPRDVRDMSLDDIHLALSQELAAWTLPPEFRDL